MEKELKVYSKGPVEKKKKKPLVLRVLRKITNFFKNIWKLIIKNLRKIKRFVFPTQINEYFYTGKSVRKEALKYFPDYSREISRNYETSFNTRTHLPVKFQAKEKVIEDLINTKNYEFKEPLVILNPYDISPLCALAIFNTENECAVRATVKGDEPRFDVSGEVSKGKHHRVPIIGLYPDRENEVILEILDDEGKAVESKSLNILTKPLPEVLENMVRVYKDSGNSAYPLIYVAGKGTKLPYAFDQSGAIRYYLDYRPRGYGLFPLKNGRFMFIDKEVLTPTFEIPHSTQMYEMDWFGRVYKTYQIANGAHHDVFEKEDGNIMFVSNSLDLHMEDVVTEIDRNTGEIIQSVDMRDVLGDDFRDYQNWVHCNSCQHDPKTNTALISPRNVHSVINIDWDSGKLNWILCDPRFWEGTDLYDKVLKPVGEVNYQYQQHSAFYIHEDLDGDPDTIHLMVFDNHWHARRRLEFFDNDEHSYVKIFTINQKEMTVKLEHQYQGIKSKITSNGLLEYDAKRVFSMGAFLEKPYDEDRNAMIYEFDYDTEEPLNQYGIKDNFFRAYQFKPNYDQLATPMQKDLNYLLGKLKDPEETKEDFSTKTKFPRKHKLYFKRYEEDIYMFCKDHTVKKVFFKGENINYLRDLTDTHQTRPAFSEMEYFITIPMKNMKNDSYEIYVLFEDDKWYNTKETVKISD